MGKSDLVNKNEIESENIEEEKEIIDYVEDSEIDNKDKNLINKASSEINTKDSNNEFEWYLKIPKIELYAPIEEGTDEEVLNRSIGHFEETSIQSGNCGLAGHNRGYNVNYFARLKELKEGDLIEYFVNGEEYKYKINQISIIYETDWSVFEDTEENKITLITCVENRDEYRLCVQGYLIDT